MALPILQEAAGKIALAGRRTLGTPAPGELRKPSKVLKDGVSERRQTVKPHNVNDPAGIQKYSHHTA